MVLKFISASQEYIIGKRRMSANDVPESAGVLLMPLTKYNPAEGPLRISFRYSPPTNPFHGTHDIDGKPVTINEIAHSIIDSKLELVSTTHAVLAGNAVIPLHKLKKLYPDWFDFKFLNGPFVPDITNYDLSLLSLIDGFATTFQLSHKPGRHITTRSKTPPKPAAPRKATKRKIKSAR